MQIKEIVLGLILIAILFGGIMFLSLRNKSTSNSNDNMQNTGNNSDQLQAAPQSTSSTQPKASGTPEMMLKESTDYQAVLKTSMGDITIDLYEKDSPITVNNFVSLAKDGFYDGLIFHRVIEDFMIQGGDPTGTGMGGPNYKFNDEINNHKLVKGALAMANAGPNTNGSQFFIVTAAETPWLDGKHTNFGQVTSGLDVTEAISKVKTGPNDKPLEPVTINSVEIIEK